MTVRIVTDSTADIPSDQAQALGVSVIPLTVFFGDDAYLDGIEIDNAQFYRKLVASKVLPRTSQPSPVAFQETYLQLINEGAEAILSVHLSSKLSGTYQSACHARDTLPKGAKHIPIEIVDSQSISTGISMSLLRAAAEAREGHDLAAIKSRLENRLSRTSILAVMDSLDYVQRGGRIGKARALLGNMLSIKPIIALKDGEVIPVEQPRTRNKAYTRIAQLIAEAGTLEQIAIVASSEDVAQALTTVLKSIYQDAIPIYKLGAILGTHTGPGTVAVAFMRANHEKV